MAEQFRDHEFVEIVNPTTIRSEDETWWKAWKRFLFKLHLARVGLPGRAHESSVSRGTKRGQMTGTASRSGVAGCHWLDGGARAIRAADLVEARPPAGVVEPVDGPARRINPSALFAQNGTADLRVSVQRG